jgi:putative membrane protein
MWNGPSDMMDGAGWGWLWPFHFIFPILFWALIIVLVVVVARAITGPGEHRPPGEQRPSGLDILQQRYARGEINRDEYLEKKRDILGQG